MRQNVTLLDTLPVLSIQQADRPQKWHSSSYPLLFICIRYCSLQPGAHSFTIPYRMHSPWSHVTTANHDSPHRNIVPDRDLMANKPAVPMWLNSTWAGVSYRRSQRSLLGTNVDAAANQLALRMYPGKLCFFVTVWRNSLRVALVQSHQWGCQAHHVTCCYSLCLLQFFKCFHLQADCPNHSTIFVR